MRYLRLMLVPLVFAACAEQAAVAPDIDATPMLGATHDPSVITVSDLSWYTEMDCLGYNDRTQEGDRVYWTASWVKIFDDYLHLPNGKPSHLREYAEWSDDLQFEEPTGVLWETVDNVYTTMNTMKLSDPMTTHFHESAWFENAATGARLKMINTNQVSVNAHGDVRVSPYRWGCILTRPGK
jgi:hypothetical protein